MKGKTTKTVLRAYWSWNDEKEERWLGLMARAGWHLSAPRGIYYVFKKGDPADAVYRLDYQNPRKSDRAEYLALFKDSGWEHVGEFGNWQYFRILAGPGPVPEIHTDVESRIAKYRRLLGLLAIVMAAIWFPIMSSPGFRQPASAFWQVTRVIQAAGALLTLYGIIRLGIKIRGLKKSLKAGEVR